MKKIILDLTPLLDIVLILLFAFMLNINVAGAKKDEQLLEQENKNKYQNEVIEKMEQEIDSLNIKNIELQDTVDVLQYTMKSLNEEVSKERETIQKLSEHLANWFKSNETTIKEYIPKDRLDILVDSKQIVENLFKYETITRKYFFIDIQLNYPGNKLVINDKYTNIYITLEEASNMYARDQKKEKIKDRIEKIIDNREGGYTFILITASRDRQVHRLSYTLLWEAIKEIEEKYGTDRVFKTEFNYKY